MGFWIPAFAGMTVMQRSPYAGTHPHFLPHNPPRRGGSRTARPHPSNHMSFRAQRTQHVILNVAQRTEESIAPLYQRSRTLPMSSRLETVA